VIEATLISIGVASLLWFAAASVRASYFQRTQNQILNSPTPTPAHAAEPDTGLVGRLEIPHVGLSVVVMHGDDEETLSTAAGHLPDTPMPWQAGNSAIAAHRDTFFRPLKDVRQGDEVRLVSRRGTFIYKVRDARVISPKDVSVLKATSSPTLTLLTCYPFFYVGNAPKRYVVQADLIASTPASNEVR